MPVRPSRYELALLVSMVVLLAWSGIHPHDRFTWWLEVGADLHRRAGADLALPNASAHPAHLHPDLDPLPDPHAGRPLHLRAGAAGLLDPGLVRVQPGITTTGSGTSPRGSFRRCSRGRSSSAARHSRGSRWLPFLVVCFCLAFSAFYELIEFWTALSAGGAATDFLGTQGDVWDTQWDMQLALIGSIVSLVLLSRSAGSAAGGAGRCSGKSG